jgi:hypothetical protein
MTRLTIAALLGLAAAGALAWSLGGALGAGVLAGYAAGAGITGLGVLAERRVLETRPELGLQVALLAFLSKLVLLVSAAVGLRFVAPLAARMDWRAFLVAFAAAVVVLLPIGTIEAVRVLKRAGART